MRKFIYPFILLVSYGFLVVGCQLSSNNNDTVTETIFDKTDAYVEKMMDSLEIIGLNYAVLIDGKVTHKKSMGVANIEHQVPMNLDHLFAVASISKLFSSTALHRLLKSKNRNIKEAVGAFLPNRNGLPDSWRKLSLKQLLSHTSGMPDQIDYEIYLAPESEEYVIEGLKDKPFSSPSGDANKYNATGFLLVRMIIEALAEQDFETHMQENYFDKFNLAKANYGGFKKVVPNRVKSYRMVGENLEMFPLNYSPPMYAAAGLNINIDELVLWIQAVLAEKIVSKEYLTSIWTPVKLNNGNDGYFGLGWETNQLENKLWATGHGGAGISSIRHYWKEDAPGTVTVILLTNGARNWVQMPDDVNMGIAKYFMP
ncbi:MAG: CubicO group peptidase (beta-lactamase class C family) [Saprospiraceae bacterium]|jgi:CubicO group peptidase (beta-lactamase class C family)